MKKLLGIVVLGLLWCNVSYPLEFFGKYKCVDWDFVNEKTKHPEEYAIFELGEEGISYDSFPDLLSSNEGNKGIIPKKKFFNSAYITEQDTDIFIETEDITITITFVYQKNTNIRKHSVSFAKGGYEYSEWIGTSVLYMHCEKIE